MATTQKTVRPVQKSKGFTGIRNAFWVLIIAAIVAIAFYIGFLGDGSHFVNGDNTAAVLNGNIWGTMYKGGIIVPILMTFLLTVLCLAVERWLAMRTAFGKGSLSKFVQNIKEALAKNDFNKAQELCNKQKGSVANVVNASLRAYSEMQTATGLTKGQKVAKIEQAHEEATQLEMPTLTMNLPILATMVTLGTLTGLLGTVIGMIRSFAALAAGGGGDSLQLSTGISQALVNTAFGIATSWCAVVFYNYFTNKVDKLTYALDEVGYTIAQTYEANHTDEA